MSLFSFPLHNYQLPHIGNALCSVTTNENFNSNFHLFFAATNSPHQKNQIHLINYDEDLEKIYAISAHSLPTEIQLISSIYNTFDSFDENEICLLAIASRNSHTSKEECQLYNLKFDKKDDSNLNHIYNLQINENGEHFKKLVTILDLNSQPLLATVNTNGFSIFSISHSINQLNHKKLHSIHQAKITSGCFDPHHTSIFLLSHNSSFSAVDLRSNEFCYRRFEAHPSAKILDVDFNPNIPHKIISGGEDGALCFWDVRYLHTFYEIIPRAHSHWITSTKYNPYHDQLIITSGTDNTVKLHKKDISFGNSKESSKNQLSPSIKIYEDHEDSVYNTCWSGTDAWCFASISYDGKISINQVPDEEKYKILL